MCNNDDAPQQVELKKKIIKKHKTTSSFLLVEDELPLVTECLARVASDRMHSAERNRYNWSVCFPASIVLTFGMTLSQNISSRTVGGAEKETLGSTAFFRL